MTSQQIVKCGVFVSSFIKKEKKKKGGGVMDAEVVHSRCFDEPTEKAREVAIADRQC